MKPFETIVFGRGLVADFGYATTSLTIARA
jgi:hypothetical protein